MFYTFEGVPKKLKKKESLMKDEKRTKNGGRGV
jgi:hypothetical protein